MENLRPNRGTNDNRQSKKEAIESWDDDEDFLDLRQLRSFDPLASTHSDRESLSGRHPGKCDTPLSFYEESHQQEILLPSDIESTNAIRSAINAGIPIPPNVPLSALLGGTIKRLGTRKLRRPVTDDWTDELVIPALGQPFTVKRVDSHEFPQALPEDMRHSPGPGNQSRNPKAMMMNNYNNHNNHNNNNSNNHNSNDNDDEIDEDQIPTVRAPRKVRTKPSLKDAFVPPHGHPRHIPTNTPLEDDMEKDFSLPDTQDELKLASKYADRPTTPAVLQHDSDFEDWGEGSSLGTRHGGRRQRSSSIASALSSSMSSTFTMESEDEGMDGLEFPEGDLNFKSILERKRQLSLEAAMHESLPRKMMSEEDFFNDLDVQDGRVFDTSKVPLSRNIKHRPQEPKSPIRRTALALTFTKKGSGATVSRPRRLSNASIPHLETVAESSPRPEDPSNASMIPHAPKPKPSAHAGGKLAPDGESVKSLRSQKSTPNLRSGGSLGSKLRQPLPPPGSTPSKSTSTSTPKSRYGADGYPPSHIPRPSSRTSIARPPSRTERYTRPPSREPVPPNRPPSRNNNNNNSNNVNRPQSRTSSRPSSRNELISRSRSPRRPFTPSDRSPSRGPHGGSKGIPFLPAGSSVQQSQHINVKLTRQSSRQSLHSSTLQDDRSQSRTGQHRRTSPSPVRRDLALTPDTLRKEAVATNTLKAPARRRNFGDGNELLGFDDLPTNANIEKKFVVQPSGRGAPKTLRTKKLPVIASLQVQTPHFARETAASRIAREQSSDHSRPPRRMPVPRGRKRGQQQQKPHLIKPLGSNAQLKEVKGMVYNPTTYCWEGNDADVQSFERRDQLPTTPPRPALIASVNSPKNIKVVGGMVFDPTHMCWLKVKDQGSDDEGDVFAGIDDLDDSVSLNAYGSGDGSGSVGPNMLDYPLSEEFDVGPEFVRRQREEEERWKSKVKGWITEDEDIRQARFYDIRRIAFGAGP